MPIDIEGYTRLTAKDLHPEGIQYLTEAIVARAADDWRSAVAAQKRGNALNEYRRSRKEVEQFFLSDWFYTLTGLDGQYVLKKLKQEAGIK